MVLRPQHTGEMSNAWQDLRILTGNDWRSVRGDPSCVRLRRGAALSDPGGIPLWKRWQDVALARIAVAHEQIRQSVVFCGESALAIHGVPQWISNPDVEFTSGRAYTASWFPRVDVGDQCVPRVRVRRVTRKHPLRGVGNVRGLPAEDLWTTSVLIAAMRPPLEAFVAVSMALRRLSRFDRRDLAGSRVREEEARRILLELVAQGEDAGAYGMGRARRVVLAADAGCESVGETALLYVLTATSHEAPATQVPVRTRGGREFFLDAAVPGRKKAWEFDGTGKMGTNSQEFNRAVRQQQDRQRLIEAEGWQVERVLWQDFEDFAGLRDRIADVLEDGGLVGTGRGRLWVPEPDSGNEARRIHVRADPVAQAWRSAVGTGPVPRDW